MQEGEYKTKHGDIKDISCLMQEGSLVAFLNILPNILKNKRVLDFENIAKCAYKPIFWFWIKNSISPKVSLTTFLHSADDFEPTTFPRV